LRAGKSTFQVEG